MVYRFPLLELCGFEEDIYRPPCDISEIETVAVDRGVQLTLVTPTTDGSVSQTKPRTFHHCEDPPCFLTTQFRDVRHVRNHTKSILNFRIGCPITSTLRQRLAVWQVDEDGMDRTGGERKRLS